MISKSYVFGGGLLVNTIAIFASISSDVVAESARNKINQIYWRIKANNMINYPFSIKATDAWIQNSKYDKSIKEVIGKAIGDCVTKEGVFSNKEHDSLILFPGTNTESYEQANWNAVVLYNYVFQILTRNDDISKIDGAIRKSTLYLIKNELCKQYSDILKVKPKVKIEGKTVNSNTVEDMISRASIDIAAYATALNIESILWKIKDQSARFESAKTLRNFAPNLTTTSLGENTKEVSFSRDNAVIYDASNLILERKENNDLWNWAPRFQLIKDNWHIIRMDLFSGQRTEDHYQWSQKGYSGTENAIEIKKYSKYVLKLLDGLVKLLEEEEVAN